MGALLMFYNAFLYVQKLLELLKKIDNFGICGRLRFGNTLAWTSVN